jgi:hypothetical protein
VIGFFLIGDSMSRNCRDQARAHQSVPARNALRPCYLELGITVTDTHHQGCMLNWVCVMHVERQDS